MAKIARVVMEKTFVANTAMCMLLTDDVHSGYEIKPCEGYKLHDGRLDRQGEEGETIPGFRTGTVSVGRSYDFEGGGKYGFYTVLI